MLHRTKKEIGSLWATRPHGKCGACGGPMIERQRLAFRRPAGQWTPGELVHYACRVAEDEILAAA
jgi:hypothetical protein